MQKKLIRSASIVKPPIDAFKNEVANCINPDYPLIDLTQGVPSFRPPKMLFEGISPEDCSVYTQDQGLPQLVTLIAKEYDLYRLGFDKNFYPIIITAGANQAACTIFSTLFCAGDSVSICCPYYFNYDMALKLLDVEVNYIFLSESTAFTLTADSICRQIKPQTRGLVIVNPNNPTGSQSAIEEIIKIHDFCMAHDIYLIIDETYGYFADKKYPQHYSLITQVKSLKNLFMINTFSKIFGITGFRVGYLIADPDYFDELMKVQDTIIISAPHYSQKVAINGLKFARAWMQEIQKTFQNKIVLMQKAFRNCRNFTICSIGPFYAYVKNTLGIESRELAHKLAGTVSILCLPGDIFGPYQEEYARFSIGSIKDEDDLQTIVNRLNSFSP